MAEQTNIRMTAAEFFTLPENNRFIELIHGALIPHPTPLIKHQAISGELLMLLSHLTLTGEVFHGPIDLYVNAENVLQPDLLWIAENSRCTIGAKYLEGPPDLIIEIFSPGMTKRDKSDKFSLYERFGVREYWMVDPVEKYVEVYVWDAGKFVRQGVYGENDQFISAVLAGKTVELSGLFN